VLYPNRRLSGFTLIELLVVIAIIAILAAIIFPVYRRVKQNARKTACLANLHQLDLAMKSYQSDSDGFLPSWCITDPNPNSPPTPKSEPDEDIITWDVNMLDYIETEGLLVCFANPVAGNAAGGDPQASAGNARAYAMPRYTQWNFGGGRLSGVEVARIPNPVSTVLLYEKGANRPGTWGDAIGENAWQSHDSRDQLGGYRDDMFHFSGKNFLFVDGHTKYFEPPKYLSSGVQWPEDPAWDKEDDTITILPRPDTPGAYVYNDPSKERIINTDNPFAWDSGRRNNNNCGPGVMELSGPWYRGGDWPPAAGTWPPDPDAWPLP